MPTSKTEILSTASASTAGFAQDATTGRDVTRIVRDSGAPVRTQDAGRIRLGGGFRPGERTQDHGRIRLGGGFRPGPQRG